jgi:hypothetical protein
MWDDLERIKCLKCGVWFWVDKRFGAYKRRTCQSLFCPNGHELGWYVYPETAIKEIEARLAKK